MLAKLLDPEAKTPRRRPPPAPEMARPRSESSRPVARRTRAQKKRSLWGALPQEIKGVIRDYSRIAHTNESLRAALDAFFEDQERTERLHGPEDRNVVRPRRDGHVGAVRGAA